MTILSAFLERITGQDNPADFLYYIFFAFVGVTIMLLFQTTSREVNSVNTPMRFSWRFLWCDNTKRILLSVLLIYVSLRFTKTLLGFNLSEPYALGIGAGLDKISEILKEKFRAIKSK